jgi:hypothetical protein
MMQQQIEAVSDDKFKDIQMSISNQRKKYQANKNLMRNFALNACREYLGGAWRMLDTSQIVFEPIT